MLHAKLTVDFHSPASYGAFRHKVPQEFLLSTCGPSLNAWCKSNTIAKKSMIAVAAAIMLFFGSDIIRTSLNLTRKWAKMHLMKLFFRQAGVNQAAVCCSEAPASPLTSRTGAELEKLEWSRANFLKSARQHLGADSALTFRSAPLCVRGMGFHHTEQKVPSHRFLWTIYCQQ